MEEGDWERDWERSADMVSLDLGLGLFGFRVFWELNCNLLWGCFLLLAQSGCLGWGLFLFL